MGLGFKIELQRVEKYTNYAKDSKLGRTCCLHMLLINRTCDYGCEKCRVNLPTLRKYECSRYV